MVQSYLYKGKEVYVVSEQDLHIGKRSGRNYRVHCPVHHSRDVDASIAGYSIDMTEEDERLAGWGLCYGISCNATILVQEWNRQAAARVMRIPLEQVGSADPKIVLNAKEVARVEAWQKAELQALEKLYPVMQKRLSHERCMEYLKQRGCNPQSLPILAILQHLGVGYIPPMEEWKSPPPHELQKWCDRIIFPYTTVDGTRGFSGRTLALWQIGMDENEHKRALEEDEEICLAHGKAPVRRWLKTHKNGIINASALAENREIRLCESGFDLIPWLLEGYLNTVAVGGHDFYKSSLPTNVRHVLIAFDVDMSLVKLEKLKELLGSIGITSEVAVPPLDGLGKDWSERYRRLGREGLLPLLTSTQEQSSEPLAVVEPITEEQEDSLLCSICGINADVANDFHFAEDGTPYCDMHLSSSARSQDSISECAVIIPPVANVDELVGTVSTVGAENENTKLGLIPMVGAENMNEQEQPIEPQEHRVIKEFTELFGGSIEVRPLVDGKPTQPWAPKEVQAHGKLSKSNLYCSQCWDAYSAQSIYKRAVQHDANDIGYCEKCWQERQFHASTLLNYGKKYDWPFMRTLVTTVEGQTAYELFVLTATPLDIIHVATAARRLDVSVVPDIIETYTPAKKKEKFENVPIEPNSGDTLECLVHDIKQLWSNMPQHYANRKQHCRVDKQLWIEDGTWTLLTLGECKKRVQAALKRKDIENLQKTRFAMRDILESGCHGHKA